MGLAFIGLRSGNAHWSVGLAYMGSRSGNAHARLELAYIGSRSGGAHWRRRERERARPLIKSGNPHLAGGSSRF